jgi:hypothetical protein
MAQDWIKKSAVFYEKAEIASGGAIVPGGR